MVKIRDDAYNLQAQVNFEAWVDKISTHRQMRDLRFIRQAHALAQLAGDQHATYTGESAYNQGLNMAVIADELRLDAEAVAAAMIYPCAQYSELTQEDIIEHLGRDVAKLVEGVDKMDAIRTLQSRANSLQFIDNLRKMLLAMVDDVRVVLIKLAEQLCMLHAIYKKDAAKQKILAEDALSIYAPLANRLGVGHIKWELEDLAFRYLQPDTYKDLAKKIAERRIDREAYIQRVVQFLEDALKNANIKNFQVNGRAKHIYSIYRKMQRKDVGIEEIYDAMAMRVLVPSIEDCYTVLGIVHSQWQHIKEEFDDYITAPKSNGYRSLHTAVVGPQAKNVEVQIRTFEMHEESELGVAAHWVYKEGAQQSGYEAKIAWLRQVMDWQRELAQSNDEANISIDEALFADRVYVFTPSGDIVDLATGCTPLDFAYHIHSEVGHRCRGAKVNDRIVPLTYVLQTGDQIEILTGSSPKPSRDWMSATAGYLKSARAKAKVHHWFKLQDYDEHVKTGIQALEREVKRTRSEAQDFESLTKHFKLKHEKDLFAAIGRGDLTALQVINAGKDRQPLIPTSTSTAKNKQKPHKKALSGISIQGIENLLSHTARCCKPIPGDDVVGYITQGNGVSVHRQTCVNIENAPDHKRARIIDVEWQDSDALSYPASIHIIAYDRTGLAHDITTLLAQDKIELLNLTSHIDKNENIAKIRMDFEINDLRVLSKVISKIRQLPNVVSAERIDRID